MVQGACQISAIEPPLVAATSLLAPPWHTRALVALMLAVAAAGTALGHVAGPTADVALPVATTYLPLALVNLGLLLYTCRIGLERSILARVFSQGRYDAPRVLADLAWGAGVALALIGAEKTLQWLLGLPESVAAHALLPPRWSGFRRRSSIAVTFSGSSPRSPVGRRLAWWRRRCCSALHTASKAEGR